MIPEAVVSIGSVDELRDVVTDEVRQFAQHFLRLLFRQRAHFSGIN